MRSFLLVLLYLFALAGRTLGQQGGHLLIDDHGAVIRGPTDSQELALVFTGDEFGDGTDHIGDVLSGLGVRASFFFTGRFYRNPAFEQSIRRLASDGHYLGAHSDRHLLYNSWDDRDSLLVSESEFSVDVLDNYAEMERFGISLDSARYFIPPYEWYNEDVSRWTRELGLTLVNYTPGTRSHADYTTPDLPYYASTDEIVRSIMEYEERDPNGLNGFVLLMHVGSARERTDKLYRKLEALLDELESRGYLFVRIDRLLED